MFESVVGGAVGGLVASLVYALLGAAYQYWRRPWIEVRLVNVKRDGGQAVAFALRIKNSGATAFLEPTINIDGFAPGVVQILGPNTSWVRDEGKMVYNHHKSL